MATSIMYRRNVADSVLVFIVFVSNVFGGEFASARVHDLQSPHQDFDCVDIYQQPAFDHPLLKNHAIQMKPSSYPKEIKGRSQTLQEKTTLDWIKTVECPPGTVPIAKKTMQDHYGYKLDRSTVQRRWFNQSYGFVSPPGHEHAQVSLLGGGFHGAHAIFNVWNPQIESGEFSLAQIWVIAGPDDTRNTVEAGWIAGHNDTLTRLFIYWTADNYHSTGCYNLECPGFVQVTPASYIGGPIEPVSAFGGQQRDMEVLIHKDESTGNWWLRVQDTDVGYWPSSLFTSLHDSADMIFWGGEITNGATGGHHTTTQMGSGHFPSEGIQKSAYIRNIGYVDGAGAMKDPGSLETYATKPQCYDVQIQSGIPNFGVYFFFGGPGYSAQCPN